jgi:thioredoxin-dependent peroxiredoxin
MAKTKLQIGDPAPDFELTGDDGSKTKLSAFRGRRVVVYFYPKDDTPGCTTQACGFRDRYPQIEEQNAVVLGISPDDLASHKRFKTKYNLPFHLLVDEGHRVAEAYGVWDGGNLRSHFVVDEGGRLADIQIKVKPEESVTRALDALGITSPGK